jgi:nucleoside-diphosphate-sugar epimerase
MVSLRTTVLLTGASGVVGSALIPKLQVHRVMALSHRRRPPGPVEQVHGDLTKPRLGLSRQTYNTLTAQIDTVVHCAAPPAVRLRRLTCPMRYRCLSKLALRNSVGSCVASGALPARITGLCLRAGDPECGHQEQDRSQDREPVLTAGTSHAT